MTETKTEPTWNDLWAPRDDEEDMHGFTPYVPGSDEQTRDREDVSRAKGLVVTRLSSKSTKRKDMASMVEQTYQNVRHVPELDAVRRAGMAPMYNDTFKVSMPSPDGVDIVSEVSVMKLPEYDGARLFTFGGYWHLWVVSSATKEILVDEYDYVNPFTQLLIDTIRKYRPRVLVAATASRLVRAVSHSHLFLGNLERNVDMLNIGGKPYRLIGSGSSMTYMYLNFEFWAAAQERDYIVTRMATGRIGSIRANQWPIGKTSVPLGHVLDENKQLKVNPADQELVAAMMEVLVTDVPDAMKVEMLAELGLRNRNGPISSAANPTAALNGLYAWAPLWLSGEYLWRLAGNYSGKTELAGVPVSRRSPRDGGELQSLIQLDQIEGGWADEDLLLSFRAAALARSAASNASVKQPRPVHPSFATESRDLDLIANMKPSAYLAGVDRDSNSARAGSRAKGIISTFTGRTWTDAVHHHEVRIFGDMYAVRRRLKSQTSGGLFVAQFTRAAVHDGLLPALAAAVRDGVDAVLKPDQNIFTAGDTLRTVDTREQKIATLRQKAAGARKRAKKAYKLARSEDSDDRQSRELLADERRETATADRLDERVRVLEQQVETTELPYDKFDAVTDVWLPALTNLHGRDRVPQNVYRSLGLILTDFKLVDSDGLWTGSVRLNINTADGTFTTEPITWDIGPGGNGTMNLAARHVGAKHTGGVERAVLSAILRSTLGVTKAAVDVLEDSPFPELAHVVAHVCGLRRGVPHELPAWVGPQWRRPSFMKWVADIYSDPNFRWTTSYSRVRPLRQKVVDYVIDNQPLTGIDMLAALNPLPQRFTHYLAHRQPVGVNGIVVPRQPSIQRSKDIQFKTRTHRPFTCIEGHDARIVTLVPEIVTDLLCECGRMAGVSHRGFSRTLVFPDEYQLLLAPPRETANLADVEQDSIRNRKVAPLPLAALRALDRHGPMLTNDLRKLLVANGDHPATTPRQTLQHTMEDLQRRGLVVPVKPTGWPRWLLTPEGQARV